MELFNFAYVCQYMLSQSLQITQLFSQKKTWRKKSVILEVGFNLHCNESSHLKG